VAVNSLAAVALSVLPQVYLDPQHANYLDLASTYCTNFPIFLIGRHIANKLWEREFRARQQSESYYKSLLQSEKTAVLGRLTAGLAHELNNPLAIIASNLVSIERAAAHLSSAGEADEIEGARAALSRALDRLRMGANRLYSINSMLRQYISPPRQEMRPTDVKDILELAIGLVEPKVSRPST
jgi:C4-dicarboxylate-specific signal transduction histidine kinase